jgi:hypothetical protein
MPNSKTTPEITKRKVTARSISLAPEAGMPNLETVREDYVRPDFLDAYVNALRESGRWQTIEVSEEPDAGPGGYDGATYVPPGLAHPLAGAYYPASDCKNCSHAPEGARVVHGSEV